MQLGNTDDDSGDFTFKYGVPSIAIGGVVISAVLVYIYYSQLAGIPAIMSTAADRVARTLQKAVTFGLLYRGKEHMDEENSERDVDWEPLLPSRIFGLKSPASSGNLEEGIQMVEMPPPIPDTPSLLPESLDYESVENDIFRSEHYHHSISRKFYGYTGLTVAKYVLTLLIGTLTGCLAFLMQTTVKAGIEYKLEWMEWMMATHGLAWSFAWHALVSCSLILISACLIQFWAPEAAGGGVTLVMAYLNGIYIPYLLSLRALIAKVVGTSCGLLAQCAIGPEGPMVHIGAAMAAVMTTPFMTNSYVNDLRMSSSPEFRRRAPPRWFSSRLLVNLLCDLDQREFISAGAGAGIAAAFGAPIGGVLFALEEASSYWSNKVSWRTFLAAAMAVFVLSTLNSSNDYTTTGMVSLEGLKAPSRTNWVIQLPFFFLMAALAGTVGAVFNILHGWLARVRAPKTNNIARLAEAVVICVISVGFMFTLPLIFPQCRETPESWPMEELTEYGVRFMCPEGQYNEVATLYLSFPEDTIRLLLMTGEQESGTFHKHFTIQSLCVHAFGYIILSSLACGAPFPGGLFMPSIMLGASFGGILGGCLMKLLPTWHIQPGLYSLIGATAVLGGVFRSSISLVVIVMEGTGGIDFVFTIIVAIAVSNWVASVIHHPGIYESDIDRDNRLGFLTQSAPRAFVSVTAEDIMTSPAVAFHPVERASTILQVLRSSRHNGFPVYDQDETVQSESGAVVVRRGQLLGLILRSQLLVLLKHRQFMFRDAQPPNSPGLAGEPSNNIQANEYHDDRDEERVGSYTSSREPGAVRRTMSSGGVMSGVGSVSGSGFDKHPREPPTRRELILDTEMRTFHHLYDVQSRQKLSHPDVLANYDPDQGLEHEGPAMMDLTRYMNRPVMTVRKECSAHRVYTIFRALGLRHLVVVDADHHPVGMITRLNLMHAPDGEH